MSPQDDSDRQAALQGELAAWMERHQDELELVAAFCENGMERYDFPDLSPSPPSGDSDRSAVDREALVPKPQPPTPSQRLVTVVTRMFETIFGPNRCLGDSEWLGDDFGRFVPQADAAGFLHYLWGISLAQLDGLRHEIEERSPYQHAARQCPPPTQRALFFAWQLLVLEGMFVGRPLHLASYCFIEFRNQVERPYTNWRVLEWLERAAIRVFTGNEGDLLDQACLKLMTVVSPGSEPTNNFTRWLHGCSAARTALAESFQANPEYWVQVRSNSLFHQLGCIQQAAQWLKFDLPTLRRYVSQWANEQVALIAGRDDLPTEPERLSEYQSVLDPPTRQRLLRLGHQLATPLHRRSEITVALPNEGSVEGRYRITEQKKVTDDMYEPAETHRDVLELHDEAGWRPVLQVMTYEHSEERMEGRVREAHFPKLVPALFVDEHEQLLYAEQEDGHLWASADGENWSDAQETYKARLYEDRLDELKRVDVSRIS